MAFLPSHLAEESSKADPTSNYPRTRDGRYRCVHLNTVYEDKLKNGPALIVRHRILESKPIKEGVDPSPPGEILSLFMPDYGKAKVMLTKNFKAYILALLALENKKGDPVFERKLAETMQLIGGPQQVGRGMLIDAQTFHTETDDEKDFMGYNWSAVQGENNPAFPSVVARRAALDSEKNDDMPSGVTAGNGAASASSSIPDVGGSIPDIAPADPLAAHLYPTGRWRQHPKNSEYVYAVDEAGNPKGGVPPKSKADLLAGR